ncbi:50S ribosomal protein L13 [bacterium]|nr:50S ribosomal protein L13 [bacterium]MBU1614829.1 50S ribosomal protein L13 [bacterium]
MKTYIPTQDKIEKRWLLIDAKDKILGRLCSRIALILQGKNKPCYTPHLDVGDNVVIINAKGIMVTGRKEEEKTYYRYSGYPSGLKKIVYKDLMAKKPEGIIRLAIKGMLPKNKLRKVLLNNLRIYPGVDHPHQAQKPEAIEV